MKYQLNLLFSAQNFEGKVFKPINYLIHKTFSCECGASLEMLSKSRDEFSKSLTFYIEFLSLVSNQKIRFIFDIKKNTFKSKSKKKLH